MCVTKRYTNSLTHTQTHTHRHTHYIHYTQTLHTLHTYTNRHTYTHITHTHYTQTQYTQTQIIHTDTHITHITHTHTLSPLSIKRGTNQIPITTRAIAVSSVIGKLFSTILIERLIKYRLKFNPDPPNQLGFTKNAQTYDHKNSKSAFMQSLWTSKNLLIQFVGEHYL